MEEVIDQAVLISDLNHRLEEARAKVEVLQELNRDLNIQVNRAQAACEALQGLISELWERR
jgi:hypothetical protein